MIISLETLTMGPETIKHMFWDCIKVQSIWAEFKSKYRTMGEKANWDFYDIIGCNVSAQANHIVNFMVLITKQYIYRCCCQELMPNFLTLEKNIESIYLADVFNYGKNHKRTMLWNIIYPNNCATE